MKNSSGELGKIRVKDFKSKIQNEGEKTENYSEPRNVFIIKLITKIRNKKVYVSL